jgi:hypothetical protein
VSINYEQKRARADKMIRRWGALAYLRRGGVDRECWALEVQLNASERSTLRNLSNRRFLISAVNLSVPPTKEDSLVLVRKSTGDKLPPLRQAVPVAPLQPEPGGVVIYYEIEIEGSAG